MKFELLVLDTSQWRPGLYMDLQHKAWTGHYLRIIRIPKAVLFLENRYVTAHFGLDNNMFDTHL